VGELGGGVCQSRTSPRQQGRPRDDELRIPGRYTQGIQGVRDPPQSSQSTPRRPGRVIRLGSLRRQPSPPSTRTSLLFLPDRLPRNPPRHHLVDDEILQIRSHPRSPKSGRRHRPRNLPWNPPPSKLYLQMPRLTVWVCPLTLHLRLFKHSWSSPMRYRFSSFPLMVPATITSLTSHNLAFLKLTRWLGKQKGSLAIRSTC